MTAIAVKPSRVAKPSSNGAATTQPAIETLPPGMMHLDEALAVLQAHKGRVGRHRYRRAHRPAGRHPPAHGGRRRALGGRPFSTPREPRMTPSAWARNGPTTPWPCAGCGSCSARCTTSSATGVPGCRVARPHAATGRSPCASFRRRSSTACCSWASRARCGCSRASRADDVLARQALAYQRQGPSRPGGAGAGRRQRRLHAAGRPAAPAVHRRPRRAAQAQPRQRLPGRRCWRRLCSRWCSAASCASSPAARPRAPICALTQPWTPST